MNRRTFLSGLLASSVLKPAKLIASLELEPKFEAYTSYFKWDAGVKSAEEWRFITGISQMVAETIVYGNPETGPTQFIGFRCHDDE